MRGKYNRRRRPGQPRSDGFKAELDKKIHNAQVEQKKHDHDVNSIRRMIITLLDEEDADPVLAAQASMSVAAQIFMMPEPGGHKKKGVWSFVRLAWRSFRRTKLIDQAGDIEKEAADV